MFDCSIHPATKAEWILLQRASLARILVSLENRPDLEKALAAGFTAKSCESLAWYDLDTSSWKTYQRSFLTGWQLYSETWPRWGIMQDGSAFVHPMSALRMGAIDGSASQNWPTPTCNMASGGANHNSPQVRAGKHGINLAGFVARKEWPTPSAHNAKEVGTPSQFNRNTVALGDLIVMVSKDLQEKGRLNPRWVAWLMGFPLNWFHNGGQSSQISTGLQTKKRIE